MGNGEWRMEKKNIKKDFVKNILEVAKLQYIWLFDKIYGVEFRFLFYRKDTDSISICIMRPLYLYLLFLPSLLHSQTAVPERGGGFNPNLAPFFHGVAAGDPAPTGVVLWTRVTPDQNQPEIPVSYFVAKDTAFQSGIVQTGTVVATAAHDFTVKIVLNNLVPGTTYYYYFRALGKNSLIGRAKTCPTGNVEHLKFLVMSCSNYETGHFNAYGAAAQRNDIDAVLHLGDYIYEYASGSNGFIVPGRNYTPPEEAFTLAGYRARYAQYRLDPNLIRLHQQHTFISVWDDHETANDAWLGGASNHQSTEGNWEMRKALARQVYFEWMPIRDNPAEKIYRNVQYGNLCEILMLDTRLEGREQPPPQFDTPDSPPRKIISTTQYEWLTNHLKSSPSKWKVIGNQVLFSNLNVGFSAGLQLNNSDSIRKYENAFIDNWESYPTQRNALIDTIRQHHLDNTVIVSGDSHCSWAFDVTPHPVLYPLASAGYIPQPNPYNSATDTGYDPVSGAGSRAVEFGVPSISSPNFDERVGASQSALLESYMNTPLPFFNVNYNPHLKYVDLDRHGYVLLDLRPAITQADYYYVSDIVTENLTEAFGKAVFTLNGENRVQIGSAASTPKAIQDTPTPPAPPFTSGTAAPNIRPITFLGCYPNPIRQQAMLQIGFSQSTDAAIEIWDAAGCFALTPIPLWRFESGVFTIPLDMATLPAGVYWLFVKNDRGILASQKILLQP